MQRQIETKQRDLNSKEYNFFRLSEMTNTMFNLLPWKVVFMMNWQSHPLFLWSHLQEISKAALLFSNIPCVEYMATKKIIK